MKKKIIAFAALVLCMTVFASSTLAYFTKDDVATNVFTTGGIDINLVEKHNDNGVIVDYPRDPISVMPGTTVSKIVTVENLDEPAYIRAKFDVKIVKKDTGRQLPTDVVIIAVKDNWEKHGDWYYYHVDKDYVVPTATSTTEFFDSVQFKGAEMGNEYRNCAVTVDVSVEAVQSKNNPIPADKTIADVGGWK